MVDNNDDCDDADGNNFPGNPEICDGADNDCSGAPAASEADADNDGYMICDNDCNDGVASIYPGATEACDGIDNDCDGFTDEGAANCGVSINFYLPPRGVAPAGVMAFCFPVDTQATGKSFRQYFADNGVTNPVVYKKVSGVMQQITGTALDGVPVNGQGYYFKPTTATTSVAQTINFIGTANTAAITRPIDNSGGLNAVFMGNAFSDSIPASNFSSNGTNPNSVTIKVARRMSATQWSTLTFNSATTPNAQIYRGEAVTCNSPGATQITIAAPGVVAPPQAETAQLSGTDWGYRLEQSRPNPFTQSTVISYQLPVVCQVSLRVYNIAGQLIRTLEDGEQAAGYHALAWDGTNESGEQVGSGIYFYSLETQSPFGGGQGEVFSETKRMVLLR